MTLLSGPQQADGHGWWNIRTTDGREGWVAVKICVCRLISNSHVCSEHTPYIQVARQSCPSSPNSSDAGRIARKEHADEVKPPDASLTA